MVVAAMTSDELSAAARALYERDANQVKPTWDQLGEATRRVWEGYVLWGCEVQLW